MKKNLAKIFAEEFGDRLYALDLLCSLRLPAQALIEAEEPFL